MKKFPSILRPVRILGQPRPFQFFALPHQRLTTVSTNNEPTPGDPAPTAMSIDAVAVEKGSFQARDQRGGDGERGDTRDRKRGGGQRSVQARKQEQTTSPYVRVVPATPAYFSRQPQFHESYLKIMDFWHQLGGLPRLDKEDVHRVVWKSRLDYSMDLSEQFSARFYNEAISMAKDLHSIIPYLKPAGLQEAIGNFIKDANPSERMKTQIIIDRFGRALGSGRRKTATARAWLVEGTGEVQVNGKSLAEAFARLHDRESATWALRITERTDKYNVWALVEGGGTTGQAEALTLAVAKALAAHEPGLRGILRKGETRTLGLSHFSWRHFLFLFLFLFSFSFFFF